MIEKTMMQIPPLKSTTYSVPIQPPTNPYSPTPANFLSLPVPVTNMAFTFSPHISTLPYPPLHIFLEKYTVMAFKLVV